MLHLVGNFDHVYSRNDISFAGIRQSHKTFFQKSDLFFVCMLQPYSFNIQRQVSEIAAAQVYVLRRH